MAFVVKKTINNNDYYYLNENKRIDGKVKTKTIAYLGKTKKEAESKAKEIINNMKEKIEKDKTEESKLLQKKITIEELSNFCKQRGFIFRSSDIYGGFSGFWDFGPLGIEMFNNIRAEWWNFFIRQKENMVGMEASIISHPRTWKASGHIENFNVNDYVVICKKCKKSNKVDKPELGKIKCSCGGEYDWDKAQMVEQMFKTRVGAMDAIDVYLRGETAQGMFLDFKLIYQTSRMQLPFGIAQIGRCFRNEIAPRDFLFRSREFHIGEFEFFINPEEKKCLLLDNEHLKIKFRILDAETQKQNKQDLKETTIEEIVKKGKLEEWHAYWLAEQIIWFRKLGLDEIKIREHTKEELSHYSSATFDIDYEYPFGSKEVAGNANRGQFDLTNHQKESKESMEVFDEKYKKKALPKVIEPTFGMERIFLALLTKAYCEDEKGNTILRLPKKIAPIKAAIFPIVKIDNFEKIAEGIVKDLKKEWNVLYDNSGSIGRRYARNDEIGTPYCITVDEESLKNKDCTIRDRDSTKQIRVRVEELRETLKKLVNGDIQFEKAGKLVETRVK
jgi:glycyl-tRNA synthetase